MKLHLIYNLIYISSVQFTTKIILYFTLKPAKWPKWPICQLKVSRNGVRFFLWNLPRSTVVYHKSSRLSRRCKPFNYRTFRTKLYLTSNQQSTRLLHDTRGRCLPDYRSCPLFPLSFLPSPRETLKLAPVRGVTSLAEFHRVISRRVSRDAYGSRACGQDEAIGRR